MAASEILKIEDVVHRRPTSQRGTIRSLLIALCESTEVKALFLHGSLTRSQEDDLSDVDLVAVVDSRDVQAVDEIVTVSTHQNSEPAFDYVDHSYPWFGRLRCLHWTTSGLQVDFGLVLSENLLTFFVEPTALVVRDWQGKIERKRNRTQSNQIANSESVLSVTEGKVYTSLRKIHKSLARGNLWNAIEAVSQLRRLLMGLLLTDLDPLASHRVGREDKDIEKYLPADLASEIAATTTSYSAHAISEATENLLSLVMGLRSVRESWQQLDALRAVARDIRALRSGV